MRWTMFAPALLLPILAGCGPGQGKVTGRVLFEGTPVPGGWVTFRPADPRHNSVSAKVDEQGNYEPVVLPVGQVKVSFDNRELAPQPSLGPGPLPPGLPPDIRKKLSGEGNPPGPRDGASTRRSARYVEVPERYHDIETSKVQFEVKRGEQKQDIELTR